MSILISILLFSLAAYLIYILVSYLYWYYVTAPVVHMRMKSQSVRSAKTWTSRVWYDSWGTPYAKDSYADFLFHSQVELKPNGKCSDVWDSEWKIKKGTVTFDIKDPKDF